MQITDGLVQHIDQIETLKAQGKYRESKEIVERLLLDYTDDYRLYEELCDIYLFLGDHAKAHETILVARGLNPESATGMYLLGYLSVTQGNFTEGIRLLEQANALFPNNPEILRNLGWAYTVTGKGDRGVFLLKRALNIAPEDPLIMEDLAVALISESQSIDEAEGLLIRAGKEHRIAELKALMHL
jgi:Flp pilus assembly protein TadD